MGRQLTEAQRSTLQYLEDLGPTVFERKGPTLRMLRSLEADGLVTAHGIPPAYRITEAGLRSLKGDSKDG